MDKALIITVTLNAAVDITYTVRNYTLDRVHRASAQKRVPGGKGINVARVLNTLGQPVVATGFVGGHNGRLIAAGLDEEGIRHDLVQVAGESRLCIAVVDPENRTQTEVNENGPEVSAEKIEESHRKIESLLHQATHLVLSGSAPPGVPSDFYATAIRSARTAGVKVVLDSSGDHLMAGVAAGPDTVKPNAAELSAFVGSELHTVEDIQNAAEEMLKSGVGVVLVSMGRAGALVTDGTEVWRSIPPEIEFVSAVGSGDALLAAFLSARIRGESLPDALAAGTAAGAANAGVYGAGFCSAESIAELKPRVEVVRLR